MVSFSCGDSEKIVTQMKKSVYRLVKTTTHFGMRAATRFLRKDYLWTVIKTLITLVLHWPKQVQKVRLAWT